jgi:hypothetical protein
MGDRVPEPGIRRASWRQGFNAALLGGGFAWLAATLVGLTTGNGLRWAMDQAAIGTIGALSLWASYRLLNGSDEGLLIFFTVVFSAVFETRQSPMVNWGVQGPIGSILAIALLNSVRIKQESLEATTIELNPGDPSRTNSPLWDCDLDQVPGPSA